MAWFGFSVPLIFFAIFMLIVVIGIMPKKSSTVTPGSQLIWT